MLNAKDIFKRNVMFLAGKIGIAGGSELSRLTDSGGNRGVEKTYCNSLLQKSGEPINLSLDKAEIIANALGVTIQELLDPEYPNGKSAERISVDANDVSDLSKIVCTVREISKRESISNVLFEAELSAYLFIAEKQNLGEVERYGMVTHLIRKFHGEQR